MKIEHFRTYDADTFAKVVALYQPHNIGPVLHQALSGGLHNFLIVREGDDVIGSGVIASPEVAVPIVPDVHPVAWVVTDLVTASDWRRCGVATRLLEEMYHVVRRNGGRILYLSTEDSNVAAKSLYGKVGFERLRNQKDHAVFVKLIKE